MGLKCPLHGNGRKSPLTRDQTVCGEGGVRGTVTRSHSATPGLQSVPLGCTSAVLTQAALRGKRACGCCRWRPIPAGLPEQPVNGEGGRVLRSAGEGQGGGTKPTLCLDPDHVFPKCHCCVAWKCESCFYSCFLASRKGTWSCFFSPLHLCWN